MPKVPKMISLDLSLLETAKGAGLTNLSAFVSEALEGYIRDKNKTLAQNTEEINANCPKCNEELSFSLDKRKLTSFSQVKCELCQHIFYILDQIKKK